MPEKEIKILVVDDDQVIRKFLGNALKRFGKCDMACDGNEGVEFYARALAAGEPYDLVVMDIMMPVMDGMEATERITTMRNEAGIEPEVSRVLMLSCLDDAEHLSAAQFDAGADAYLTKPVEMGHLIEALMGFGFVDGGPDHAKV